MVAEIYKGIEIKKDISFNWKNVASEVYSATLKHGFSRMSSNIQTIKDYIDANKTKVETLNMDKYHE